MSVICCAAILVIFGGRPIEPTPVYVCIFYSYGKYVAAEESVIQASASDDVTRIFIVDILQLI